MGKLTDQDRVRLRWRSRRGLLENDLIITRYLDAFETELTDVEVGLVPKVALLSHSNFGSRPTDSSRKMALARKLIAERSPSLEVDGEMHADSALSESIRLASYPDSTLKGSANLLITPNLDTGNVTYNLLKMTGSNGVAMGPVLLGAARPVHILTTSATVRRVVNMTALAVVNAQMEAEKR